MAVKTKAVSVYLPFGRGFRGTGSEQRLADRGERAIHRDRAAPVKPEKVISGSNPFPVNCQILKRITDSCCGYKRKYLPHRSGSAHP